MGEHWRSFHPSCSCEFKCGAQKRKGNDWRLAPALRLVSRSAKCCSSQDIRACPVSMEPQLISPELLLPISISTPIPSAFFLPSHHGFPRHFASNQPHPLTQLSQLPAAFFTLIKKAPPFTVSNHSPNHQPCLPLPRIPAP